MEKKFRIDSKEYSLTYPQCSALPADVLEYFRRKFDDKISYAAVVMEVHKSGDPHLHAHLQFVKIYSCTCEKVFDYSTWHPNIQRTRNSDHWKRYMDKEGTPVSFGTYRSLSAKKVKLTNRDLLECDLEEMILSDQISLYSLASVLNARKAFEEIKKRDKSSLPDVLPANWDGLDLPVYPITEKKRHYWLYSTQPNKGKSTFLDGLNSEYRASYYSCQEKYQSLKADSQLLLFDEFGKGNSVMITLLNQMCDGTYKYPCKGRPAVTLIKPYLIICSNYPISYVYPGSDGRVEARFNEICLDEFNFSIK